MSIVLSSEETEKSKPVSRVTKERSQDTHIQSSLTRSKVTLALKLVPRRELQLVGIRLYVLELASTKKYGGSPETENLVFFLSEPWSDAIIRLLSSMVLQNMPHQAGYAARCTLDKIPFWTENFKAPHWLHRKIG
ncbi:hypothetical protein NC652_024314 [Populus alba x Populus x berolinensis]|nr:hypothetical protein NC652_024314 [Populus alba x Populus x berolinensis]